MDIAAGDVATGDVATVTEPINIIAAADASGDARLLQTQDSLPGNSSFCFVTNNPES